MLAAANTPKLEVERINRAMIKVLADPMVQERLVKLGLEIQTASPEEFQQILIADWQNAALIVKSSGAKLE